MMKMFNQVAEGSYPFNFKKFEAIQIYKTNPQPLNCVESALPLKQVRLRELIKQIVVVKEKER